MLLMMHFLLLIPALFAQDIAVVEKKAGNVAFYNAQSGARLSAIKVGSFPHELLFSADRRTLYVSDNGLLWMTDKGDGWNTISIIDVATRKKIGLIDISPNRRPHGMALVAKTGQILTTIENPYGLLMVDPAAKKIVRKYDVKGTSPHMVALAPDGETAYVSNAGTGTLAAINLKSGDTSLIPAGKNPQGAVISKDGKTIYLTVKEDNTILIIDTATRKVTGKIQSSGDPARLALTPDEKMLVYNLQVAEGVAFADLATRKEIGTAKLPGRPLSLHVSRDGQRAYLGIQDSDKITIVSVKDRKVTKVIDTPKDAGPDTIAELP